MRFKKLFTFLAFAFLLSAAHASGGEKIFTFDTVMHVNRDGRALIKEVIIIDGKHQNVKRGIYRDIPKAKFGKITPISLNRNYKPHPFSSENKGKYFRINFGDDNYISTGYHVYTLIYQVEHIVQPFPEYDELYWEVTGSDWVFPIERASFKLILPNNNAVIEDKISLYTGKPGSKESNAIKEPIRGTLLFRIKGMLAAGEGFTVAIPFQKGIVKVEAPFRDNWKLKIIFFIAIFTLFLIFRSWAHNRITTDPRTVVSITEFKPPEGISPAFMRYFTNKEFDTETFVVALINLAMKGKISIRQEKAKTIIEKTQTDINPAELSEEEENIMSILGNHTVIGPSASKKEQDMLLKLLKEIPEKMKERSRQYYIGNKERLIFPFFVLILAAVIWPYINGFIKYYIFLFILPLSLFHHTIIRLGTLLIAVSSTGILFAYLCFTSPVELRNYMPLLTLVYFTWLATFIFTAFIENVTEEGHILSAWIEDFKRYMKTADKYHIKASDSHAAEKIFCDYLPYAFAFDMEKEWINKFEGVLSSATIEKNLAAIGGISAVSSGSFLSDLRLSLINSGSGERGVHGGENDGGNYGGDGGRNSGGR